MDYLLLAIIAAAGVVVGFVLYSPIMKIIYLHPKCPFCGERVNPGAVRCKHCHGQWTLPAKAEK
jgi:hypothetical protein